MGFDVPFLWFTQPLGATPSPWRHFKVDGVMVNAYELVGNSKILERIVDRGGIHKYIGFDGPIAMDSGGYRFLKKGMLDVDAEEILDIYEKCKPNYGVVLDFPISPGIDKSLIEKRMYITIMNTKKMVLNKKTSNPDLIPVIHGYDYDLIGKYIEGLSKLGDFKIYGIGSLVPLVYTIKGSGSIGGIYRAVEIVQFVKSIFPERIIHVFGVGSIITMHLMFFAGADSIDSSSWRSKASYGAIQLPGVGDRYITRKRRHKKYPTLKRRERRILDSCECPACREFGLEGLRKSFKLRALHNAWIYQREIETDPTIFLETIWPIMRSIIGITP